MDTHKLKPLAQLAMVKPDAAYHRIRNSLDRVISQGDLNSPLPPAVSTVEFLATMDETTLSNTLLLLDEPGLLRVRQDLAASRSATVDAHVGSLSQAHSADDTLAACCYVLCRALRPEAVVETGVAHGATSSFILQALHDNAFGHLYSVDLPELGKDSAVGSLIPDRLRGRWTLYSGTSRELLPGLVSQLHSVDIFLHDSMHTTRNVTFELGTVQCKLHTGSAVLVDDIHVHKGFANWIRSARPQLTSIVSQDDKTSVFGVAIL